MKNYKDLVEGLYRDGSKIKARFDYDSNETDPVSMQMGSKKDTSFSVSKQGVEIHSIYRYKGEEAAQIYKEFKTGKADNDTVEKVLFRASLAAARWIRGEGIDLIVYPESGSDIVSRWSEMIHTRMPSIPMMGDLFTKNPPEAVEIDWDKLDSKPELTQNLVLKQAEQSIKKFIKTGRVKMKEASKIAAPFLINFLNLDDRDAKRIASKMGRQMKDSLKILLIDDSISSGSTQLEMARILRKKGHSVVGLALFARAEWERKDKKGKIFSARRKSGDILGRILKKKIPAKTTDGGETKTITNKDIDSYWKMTGEQGKITNKKFQAKLVDAVKRNSRLRLLKSVEFGDETITTQAEFLDKIMGIKI